MTIGIALSLCALMAAGFFIWKKYIGKSAQLLTSRSYLQTLGVQIVCGDCAGESKLPMRTFLDVHGNCSQCAGTSYVPASTLGVHMLLARQTQMYGNQSYLYEMETGADSHSSRVVSFKEHLASRTERVEKLAS